MFYRRSFGLRLFLYGRRSGGFFALFIIFLLSNTAPAFSQIADPFSDIGNPFTAQDKGEWLTLDQFAEKGANPEPQAAQEQVKAEGGSEQSDELKKAEPERPLNLPIMPSIVLAHSTVSSTAVEVENPQQEAEKPWMNVEQIADEEARQQEASKFLQAMMDAKVKVRPTVLPSGGIKSIPASKITQPKLAREQKADRDQMLAQTKDKTIQKKDAKQAQQEADACEALTEFKRRQLQAIESDRNTLAQIKSVLGELGLSERLGFMADANDGLSPTSANNTGSHTQAAANAAGTPEIKTP